MTADTFSSPGLCPLCRKKVAFSAATPHLRESLRCPGCEATFGPSNVRERGLFHALRLHRVPLWRSDVHDIAPQPGAASNKLARTAKRYLGSNFWRDRPRGVMFDGLLNVDAEAQPFENASFDLVVSLDVMEHVNNPDRVLQEAHRTLKPGGQYIFTTPTYPELTLSRRVARYREDGAAEHLEPPEYHGNPIDDLGSLVTWRFGYDLPALIRTWADFDVTVMRFDAPGLGLMGYYTEVYICTKR